jgi:hypothetical protein
MSIPDLSDEEWDVLANYYFENQRLRDEKAQAEWEAENERDLEDD